MIGLFFQEADAVRRTDGVIEITLKASPVFRASPEPVAVVHCLDRGAAELIEALRGVGVVAE